MESIVTGRERLAEWIKRSKLNQVEAARLIEIDPTQLSQILTGKRTPGLSNAIKIEQATGIQPEAWVPFDDDESAAADPSSASKPRVSR